MQTLPSRLTFIIQTVKQSGNWKKKEKQIQAQAIYLCDCGNIIEVYTAKVKNGHTRSCGCIRKEEQYKVHGLNNHRLQHIFYNAKRRCYDKKNQYFSDYGGRGVFICDEWLQNPIKFVKWGLQNGWEPGLDLDKDIKSKSLGLEIPRYSPETCQFITRLENANNKRNNVKFSCNGKTMTIPQWGREVGIKHGTIRNRIFKLGWSIEKAIEKKAYEK